MLSGSQSVFFLGMVFIGIFVPTEASSIMEAKDYFKGAQLQLGQAILAENLQAIDQALAEGANVNGAQVDGITPLMFALTSKKKSSVEALLKHKADPNQRAKNGENAVSLAMRLAPQDLEFLKVVLQYGGDPNTVQSDQDPVLAEAIGQNDPAAIQALAAAHADLNSRSRTGAPMVILAAYLAHWKCVWALVELGADWKAEDKGVTLAWLAYDSQMKPDSPAYPWLLKTKEFLLSHGVVFPPPSPKKIREDRHG
jgi:ankyrin repeat protein